MDLQNPDVSLFYPSVAQAATNLQEATIFTRINLLETPEHVATTLESTPALLNQFCLGHLNHVLIFSRDEQEHTAHVRAVMQAFLDKGMRADIDKYAFHKANWAEAGFQISPVGRDDQGAFMVVLREHIRA
ncbi:MAG: hypothetical protein LQ348_005071 [Seirophora lacunosa]|nr:MAG: hypothetical protein LQ348_005071 [Seirophora lacunosa]